jgi:hypothetical protein
MKHTEWIRAALNADTAADRVASLTKWTPDLLLTGEREKAFSDILEAATGYVRDFVKEEERLSRVGNRSDGWGERLTAFFNELPLERRGHVIAQALRLDQARITFGLDVYEPPGGTIFNWLRGAASGLIVRPMREPILMAAPDIVETVHLLHYSIASPPPPEGKHPPVWNAHGLQLAWRLAGSRAGQDLGVLRDWLPLLTDAIDAAAQRLERAQGFHWHYSLIELAGMQRCFFCVEGSPQKFSRAARLGLAGERYLQKEEKDREARLHAMAEQIRTEQRKKEKEEKESAPKPGRWLRKIEMQKRAALLVDIDPLPLAQSASTARSYVGGLPCLPTGTEWPKITDERGQAMSQVFISQIDLAQLPLISKSPLPTEGLLLLFSGCVIFVPAGETPPPRPAPDDLPPLRDHEYTHPNLSKDDPLARVEFRRAMRFAPLESYPDSEDGTGVVGWKLDTDYEEAYRQLAVKAAARAKRVLPARAVVSQVPEPPKDRPGRMRRQMMGGPFTVCDARAILSGLKASAERFTEQRSPFLPLSELGPDAAQIFLDARNIALKWEAAFSPLAEWDRFPEKHRAGMEADFESLWARVETLNKKQKEYLEAHKDAWSRKPPAERRDRYYRPYFYLPNYRSDLFGRLEGVVPFNIRRAALLGADVRSLYPQSALDALLTREDEDDDLPPAPKLHQILGWGRSIQSAPTKHADKILLFQLFGGGFGFLDNSSCVLQYWIDSGDLRALRFGQAFATLECS